MRPSDMRKQGWSEMPDDGFLALVGPLWHKETEEGTIYAILTGAKHRNRSGVVQGGLICTLADRAMGMAVIGMCGGQGGGHARAPPASAGNTCARDTRVRDTCSRGTRGARSGRG